MQQDTTSIKTTNEADISLAILHIGMLLASWDAESELLPEDLPEVNQRIFEIFGVQIWNEPDLLTARNKIVAVIEQIQSEDKLN